MLADASRRRRWTWCEASRERLRRLAGDRDPTAAEILDEELRTTSASRSIPRGRCFLSRRPRRVIRPARRALRGERASEKDCQQTIVDAARLLGYRVLAIRPAMNRRERWASPIQGDPGYPDLTLVHARVGVVFAELKRWPNRLEPAQGMWGKALQAAGARWRMVRVPEEMQSFIAELAHWSRP